MAAWCVFAKAVYVVGITAAMAVLFTFFTGWFVLAYGIRHFDEWHIKW